MTYAFDNSSAWQTLMEVSEICSLMFLARFLLIKFVFKALGASRNINPHKSVRPSLNHTLEKVYLKYGFKATKNEKIMTAATRQEGMTTEDVKKWIVERNKYDSETDLDNFNYECWELTYYVSFIVYGYLTLSQKSWFWDIEKSWTLIQKQDPDVVRYASIALAFYILETLVLSVRKYERRDYYSMRIHHACSGIVIVLFWYFDVLPFCCLLMFYGDMILPFSYISRAAKRLRLPVLVCDLCLACFMALWFAIRIFLVHYCFIPNYVNYRLRSESYSLGHLIFDVVFFSIAATNLHWTYVFGRKLSKVFFTDKHRVLWRDWSTSFSERGG